MPRQFNATILMKRPWPLDIDALVDHVRDRFPQIGAVAVLPGQQANREAGLMTIDDAKIVVMSVHAPVPHDRLFPALKTLRVWDPEPVVRKHFAQVTISCGGELPGVDGAKAYAAAVHLVASAVVEMGPALAVFWPESWSLTQPEDFTDASATILDGRVPLGVWASFATVVPRGFEAEQATGIVSYGLSPFLGRELEVAPAPIDGKTAYRRIAAIARAVLDKGATLSDGQQLIDPERTFSMTVRERDFWLRRDHPAFVLIGEDSVVDPETLRPLEQAVA